MAKLTRPDLPENALVNVRIRVTRYFGNSNKLDDSLIDDTINDITKEVHRKWHPTWSMPIVDFEVPPGNGVVDLPVDFQKILVITDQSLPSKILYRKDVDYSLLTFNNATKRVRQIQWVSPPSSTPLKIRMKYYKRMGFAVFDTDLVDMDEPNIDIIITGARAEIQLQRGNVSEYDRLRLKFENDLRDFVDDDTSPDDTGQYIGTYQDGGNLDLKRGELVDGPATLVSGDTLLE